MFYQHFTGEVEIFHLLVIVHYYASRVTRLVYPNHLIFEILVDTSKYRIGASFTGLMFHGNGLLGVKLMLLHYSHCIVITLGAHVNFNSLQ